ncbi:hypothetical protein TVAG_217390 [Trichomonas vaginalis G3]|uniref:Uncharacterized protein n=1 Tax=Trichomonas vaginalis (strain ATCC PRA-98 / G3) TaxID=412133 RepID=A2EZC1_TRIV3|nr:hypothetical protein TVAGG3_0136540 [Trichomonas vaginalis G3]EAY02002.1 hypothetical protein TVAG_217390 [Trichomonas vaginalis G3]KAI5546445.1 hypothetical protein TVAGG3_0136540 [Trichomonas vaginalis G3]|eukprot:XP_001330828.1 hypothetical protein [Trichomonas vaginalis G3]
MLEEAENLKRNEILELSHQLEDKGHIQSAVNHKIDRLKKNISKQSDQNNKKSTELVHIIESIQNDTNILNQINQGNFDNSNYTESEAINDMQELIIQLEEKLKQQFAEKHLNDT